MPLYRTVTYEIEADSEAEAEDIWADDGPELADTRRITAFGSTGFDDAPHAVTGSPAGRYANRKQIVRAVEIATERGADPMLGWRMEASVMHVTIAGDEYLIDREGGARRARR